MSFHAVVRAADVIGISRNSENALCSRDEHKELGTSLPPPAFTRQSSSLRLAPHDPFHCRGTGAWNRMFTRLKATGKHDLRPNPQPWDFDLPVGSWRMENQKAKPCLDETTMPRTGAVLS